MNLIMSVSDSRDKLTHNLSSPEAKLNIDTQMDKSQVPIVSTDFPNKHSLKLLVVPYKQEWLKQLE